MWPTRPTPPSNKRANPSPSPPPAAAAAHRSRPANRSRRRLALALPAILPLRAALDPPLRARPALRLLRLLHLQSHLPVLALPVRHHDLRSAVRNLTPPSPRAQAASIFDTGVAGTATGDYEKLRKKLGAITCGIVTACLMLTFYVLDQSYQGDGSSVHSGGTYGKASAPKAQPPQKRSTLTCSTIRGLSLRFGRQAARVLRCIYACVRALCRAGGSGLRHRPVFGAGREGQPVDGVDQDLHAEPGLPHLDQRPPRRHGPGLRSRLPPRPQRPPPPPSHVPAVLHVSFLFRSEPGVVWCRTRTSSCSSRRPATSRCSSPSRARTSRWATSALPATHSHSHSPCTWHGLDAHGMVVL